MINSTYQVTDIISQPIFEFHKSTNIQAIKQLKHTYVEVKLNFQKTYEGFGVRILKLLACTYSDEIRQHFW